MQRTAMQILSIQIRQVGLLLTKNRSQGPIDSLARLPQSARGLQDTDDLVQVEGTCEFEVTGRPILCVKDVTDPSAPVTLDLFRSCIVDAPPSWTPGLSPTSIEQCDCVPGDVRRLCVAYR